jgi:hypothetical protein
MKAKREEFWSMLEYTDPDNIIASETWLKPEIKESEVLPMSGKLASPPIHMM